MSPFAAVAVKAIGAAGVAALLSAGVVSAATPTPSPSKPTAAGTQQPSADRHTDRRAVRRAVIEAEADVLGIKPEELVKDLKAGQKVSDLAKAKGLTKEQFTARLIANLKPRLDALVDHKVITRAQADKVLDWIQTGHIPFWDGLRHRE
ncbi:MAG: hypothetical protein E6I04_06575 [Chloroflexi bacterium]|nr:MAG: hypothetical protein E6I92_09465 [Chloroflexota bacterium]TMF97597.1 MAG: hypothetical protein E6I04_06575 [Chloroflexota bacterium]